MFRSVAITLALPATRQRISAGIVLGLTAGIATAASFVPLDDLSGGSSDSQALAVSADGTTAVGVSYASGGARAFRWTNSSGMQDLGLISGGTGTYSIALGVSGDGSVVVGGGESQPGIFQASRWTAAAGMQGLGFLPPTGSYYSTAKGVSGNGSVVAGYSQVNTGFANELAYRWTSAGGMESLGALPNWPGTEGSQAHGISADGSVIVGGSEDVVGSSAGTQAFRWTPAGGMVALTPFAGASSSRAFGASKNGSVIVGSSYVSPRENAFRWTESDGMVALGSVPGGDKSNTALAVSGDGSVVVGYFLGDGFADPRTDDSRYRAFIWSQTLGMQRLFDVLVNQRATGMDGWVLLQATGVSADGLVISGWGLNPQGNTEAFVATLNAVPIPPAVWLFGSALGVLGVMRRKISVSP